MVEGKEDPAFVLSAGARAPEFTLADADGQFHSLPDALIKGPVLLTFFKISCPICQYVLPFVDRLHHQLEGKPVTVWAISQDSPDHTALFNDEFGIDLPQLFDSEDEHYPVSNAYGVRSVPTIFLVGQDGTITHISIGWNKSEIEEIGAHIAETSAFDELTPFQPGEKLSADSPGCSSKN